MKLPVPALQDVRSDAVRSAVRDQLSTSMSQFVSAALVRKEVAEAARPSPKNDVVDNAVCRRQGLPPARRDELHGDRGACLNEVRVEVKLQAQTLPGEVSDTWHRPASS